VSFSASTLLALSALSAAEVPGSPAERCRDLAQRARALSTRVSVLPFEEGKRRATEVVEGITRLSGARAQGVVLHLAWAELLLRVMKDETSLEDFDGYLLLAAGRADLTCRLFEEPVPEGPEIDRGRLEQILSRPEYDLRSNRDPFLFRLIDRIRLWLRDVFATSAGVQEAALSVRALFLFTVCLLLAALSVKLARSRLARRRRDPCVPGPVATSLDDPARYEEHSRAALSHGDGREAMRQSLLALLAAFERLRLLNPGRTLTNREIVEQLPARRAPPSIVDEARRVMGDYDLAWYGLAPVSVEEAGRFAERARGLRSAVETASERLP
jgi:hypothetical protein